MTCPPETFAAIQAMARSCADLPIREASALFVATYDAHAVIAAGGNRCKASEIAGHSQSNALWRRREKLARRGE